MEAILFAAGEPMTVGRLAEALELDEETAERLAEDLKNDINTRGGGIAMVRLGEAYQLCTAKDYAAYVRKAMDIRRNTPLSQAAMEVLAIVAYNQPVTRAFVDQVRGVDCGAVMQGLVQKKLIEEKGRLELPGRPLLRHCLTRRAAAAAAEGRGRRDERNHPRRGYRGKRKGLETG